MRHLCVSTWSARLSFPILLQSSLRKVLPPGFAVAEQSLIADFQGKRRPRCPQLPADSKTVLLDIEGTTTLVRGNTYRSKAR